MDSNGTINQSINQKSHIHHMQSNVYEKNQHQPIHCYVPERTNTARTPRLYTIVFMLHDTHILDISVLALVCIFITIYLAKTTVLHYSLQTGSLAAFVSMNFYLSHTAAIS